MTDTSYGPKPEFLTNWSGRTVGEALRGFVDHAAAGLTGPTRLDIASAYFNIGGYAVLADSLDQVDTVRLLLGAEPQPVERRRRKLSKESANPHRALRQQLKEALNHQEQQIVKERDLLGFTYEAEESANRLVSWLRSDKVQVRRLEDRFLHGKAFLVGTGSHGVVAGSSNFTRAGLTSNVELNLGNYSPYVVDSVQEWFDELWDAAVDYDAAGLFDTRFELHRPYHIYLRMLWEQYGDELKEEAKVSELPLTNFQNDGLHRATRFLQKYNGVLIADEVGLGKTFLAGELIRIAAIEQRQRVLVVAPATLRDGPWKAFMSEYNLPMELVSFEDMANDSRLTTVNSRLNTTKRLGPKLAARDLNNYAMVVVDEAHNLRNPSTQRAEALRQLMTGSPPKKLVLLTATPVNNSLWDLYYLLNYFLRSDSVFASVGIGSLRDHFARAMAMNPDDLSPRHLFDVLDAVAVRRTRSFVRTHYSNDTIKVGGREQPISFPTPRVLKVSYDMDAVLPGFFEQLKNALDPDPDLNPDEGVLTLARYSPSRYLLDQSVAPESYEMMLAGLLRSMLLKRFESSPHAFASSCETMAKSCDAFLDLLHKGRVATGEALADWIATDSDDVDEVDKYLDAHTEAAEAATAYDINTLSVHVAHDRDLLRNFAATARTVTRNTDPTLAAIATELTVIAQQAQEQGIGITDTRNRRKVLIFTYYADTVEWIYEYLTEAAANDPRLTDYRDRIAAQTGSDSNRRDVLWGFAPQTTDAPEGSDADKYDIVVTTDVLAEGVNLQQARHIINYDLPWNPMRLVQRHGRIDRIGSPHSEVFLRCVFPDTRLDDLLGLEERLHRKIKQAVASVGAPTILPNATSADRDFAETREEIERLRQEDNTLLVRGGTQTGAISGEEFRQELRQALADPTTRDDILRLSWGSGSAMQAPQRGSGSAIRAPHLRATRRVGFVFCIRVGDHPEPKFRYIEITDTSTQTDSSTDGNSVHADASAIHAGTHAVISGTSATEEGDSDVTFDHSTSTGNSMIDLGNSADNAGTDVDANRGYVTEKLDCLSAARPPEGFDTPNSAQSVSDAIAVRRLAVEAWQQTQKDFVKGWNFYADKANLESPINKTLRQAAELVRTYPPSELDQTAVDRAVDTLQTSYTERTIRTIRNAIRASDKPTEQAGQVLNVIESLGLQPPEPPEPLPVITQDDVHLVCWQALTP